MAVLDIFQIIAQTPHREFALRIGYIEIFMEKAYDLLDATVKESRIRLVNPNGRDFEVENQTKIVVTNVQQVFKCFKQGNQMQRTTATTRN